MKKVSDFFIDLVRCIITGLLIAIAISILIGIICMFMYKGNIFDIVNGIRTVLICIGAFMMILVAILILKKNKEKPMESINQWRKKYKLFSYKSVFLLVAITILISGGIIDWFLFYKL